MENNQRYVHKGKSPDNIDVKEIVAIYKIGVMEITETVVVPAGILFRLVLIAKPLIQYYAKPCTILINLSFENGLFQDELN